MNNKTIAMGLIVIIALQFTILMAEYFGAVYPLWTGKEITLKTVPYDPRSIFRGNYARLRYDIATIKKEAFDRETVRTGEVVYVKLKPGANGAYEFNGVTMDKPQSGVFIRGRIKNSRLRDYTVLYGIEALFAPKGKALALEKDLRDGGYAVVMIASTGKAALKEVLAK